MWYTNASLLFPHFSYKYPHFWKRKKRKSLRKKFVQNFVRVEREKLEFSNPNLISIHAHHRAQARVQHKIDKAKVLRGTMTTRCNDEGNCFFHGNTLKHNEAQTSFLELCRVRTTIVDILISLQILMEGIFFKARSLTLLALGDLRCCGKLIYKA